jgi:hypothetical protein
LPNQLLSQPLPAGPRGLVLYSLNTRPLIDRQNKNPHEYPRFIKAPVDDALHNPHIKNNYKR